MSSFVRYRDVGFWCSEGAVALLAGLIGERLRECTKDPSARRYGEALWVEAAQYSPGCMSLHMDDYLLTDESLRSFEGALLGVLGELASVPALPIAREKSLPHAKGYVITSATPTDRLLRYAVITLLMVKGQWDKDESVDLYDVRQRGE